MARRVLARLRLAQRGARDENVTQEQWVTQCRRLHRHAEQLDQRMRGANAAAASNLETVASPGRPGKLVGAAPGGGLAIGGGSGASGQLLATLQIVEAVRRGVEILANVVSPESRSSPSPPLRHAC